MLASLYFGKTRMTAHRSIPAACLGVLWTFLLAGCPGDDKPPVQEASAVACPAEAVDKIHAALDAENLLVTELPGRCGFRLVTETDHGAETLELWLSMPSEAAVDAGRPERWAIALGNIIGRDEPPAYAGRVDGHYLYGHDSERRLLRALRLRDASYVIITEIVSVQPLPSQRGDDLEKTLAQLAQRLSQPNRSTP